MNTLFHNFSGSNQTPAFGTIAKERVVFNLVKPGLWVSKGEKYRLSRVKVKEKTKKK